MAYYNRKEQLLITLKSIEKTKYDKNLIELIIVDDFSDEPLSSFLNIYDYQFKIIIKELVPPKTHYNPCIAYNKGIELANGDIIIIQNPEVMLINDPISFVAEKLELNSWLTLNCYGLSNFNENQIISKMDSKEIFNLLNIKNFKIGGTGFFLNDVGGWLNHYKNFFVAYHYFGAIHKIDLIEKMSGGFDNEFSNGICLDDIEFVNRLIYKNFKFLSTAFTPEAPFVIHLFHEKSLNLDQYQRDILYNRNKNIFIKRCKEMNFSTEVDIKIRPYDFTPISKLKLI